MTILKMMLRLFTTILGTTHPRKEEEGNYALLLFGTLVVIVGMVGIAVLLAVEYIH